MDNRAAEADLADFGMCLTSPPGGSGCARTEGLVEVVDSDEAMTVVAVVSTCIDGVDDGRNVSAVGGASASLDCRVDGGGLSEPGHGLSLGL